MRYANTTKNFRFEAVHHLSGHLGKCARLHGHSYKLEVTLRGLIKDSVGESAHGIVMDFGALSQIVKGVVIEQLDHQDLNAVMGIYTTAENLVHWIRDELLNHGLPQEILHRVRFWETESSFAEITQLECD